MASTLSCERCNTVEPDPEVQKTWTEVHDGDEAMWLCPRCWSRAFRLVVDWVSGKL